MPKKIRNVLPNTYRPVLSGKVITAVLSRLQKQSLIALITLWPQLKNTQPHLDKENDNSSQAQVSRQARLDAQEIRKHPSKWTKNKLIDIILYQYWSKGLNLLQLAQVDCQLLVDNPNSFHWILSTVYDMHGNTSPICLNPQDFLSRLASLLSKIFMSHIYVCTHPKYPLVLIRIQVFDLSPAQRLRASSEKGTNPHIISHKPYFLAIPMNSPHLIHSPGNDLVSQVVLNVVEQSLSKSPRSLLRLETPRSQKLIRSLDSMYILNGVSRFSHSMGSWAPYADGEADLSPLASPDQHVTHTELSKFQALKTNGDESQTLAELSNIKFKGTPDGHLKSDKLYDDQHLTKRRKTVPESTPKSNQFASIAPIRHAQFVLEEDIDEEQPSQISLKLIGNDVFAGLHELAANPDCPVVDPKIIPNWLTGEEGASCGTVKNGRFMSD